MVSQAKKISHLIPNAISLDGAIAVTTSRLISMVLGKTHEEIKRIIAVVDCPWPEKDAYFRLVKYDRLTESGIKRMYEYSVTKEGLRLIIDEMANTCPQDIGAAYIRAMELLENPGMVMPVVEELTVTDEEPKTAEPQYSQVMLKDGKVVTSSRQIAEVFGKTHYHVIRDIKALSCSEEFNASNFGLVEYTDAKGESRTEYLITRDGFTFLAMGFTGKKASAFKEQYIAAFNAMEAKLRDQQANALSTEGELLLQVVSLLTDYMGKRQLLPAPVSLEPVTPPQQTITTNNVTPEVTMIKQEQKQTPVPVTYPIPVPNKESDKSKLNKLNVGESTTFKLKKRNRIASLISTDFHSDPNGKKFTTSNEVPADKANGEFRVWRTE